MDTGERVWARTTINQAGFHIGALRSVDPNDETIQGLFETGVLVRVTVDSRIAIDDPAEASVSPPAEDEPPADAVPEPEPEASEEPSEAAPDTLFEPVPDPDSSPDSGLEDAEAADVDG